MTMGRLMDEELALRRGAQAGAERLSQKEKERKREGRGAYFPVCFSTNLFLKRYWWDFYFN